MQRYEAVQDVIANFDWDRVSQVMNYLNWVWRGEGVPDVDKMQSTAMYLMDAAYHVAARSNPVDGVREGYCATGGFEACAYIEDGRVDLRLAFVLADWSAGWWN